MRSKVRILLPRFFCAENQKELREFFVKYRFVAHLDKTFDRKEQKMKYENLEDIKIPVSRIVFGTALPAMIKGENVNDLLDSIYAEGITTFDTAENYGLS